MEKCFIRLLLLLLPGLALGGCRGGDKDGDEGQVDTIPMLIMQIQKCSRLYTTEYKVHKIVTYDDALHLRGKLFAKDYDMQLPFGDRKVAIPMDATLKAYIDFSNFGEDNVRREGDSLTVTLPDPRVVMTESKIDQEGMREYVSFARSHFSDRELSAFEKQGREAIIDRIPQMGIIERSRESAARLLIPMLTDMGFAQEKITIAFSRNFTATDIRTLLDLNNVEK